MAKKTKLPEKTKPFVTGAPTDENTFRQALKFFGIMVMIVFITFIVCSMAGVKSDILRVVINTVVEAAVLLILFSRGADLGTDAVARGEIVYQHNEKGLDITQNERKIPFHKCKGFIIGLIGSAVFFIPALLLAFTAEKQMTTAGTLPSWMDGFMRRSEISGGLAAYSQNGSLGVLDIIRIFVRVTIMPFVAMAGTENRDLLLLIERISPVLVLLPALAYGAGYLQGPSRRKQVHTEIAANTRKRVTRERRERQKKKNNVPKTPQQLN